MTARIFKPAKNAMQSGTAKTREWQLDYEPEQPRVIEPLMGWTSSGDMKQQVTIRFDTKEEAVAYCEREGIPYQVFDPKEPTRRQAAYADNLRHVMVATSEGVLTLDRQPLARLSVSALARQNGGPPQRGAA